MIARMPLKQHPTRRNVDFLNHRIPDIPLPVPPPCCISKRSLFDQILRDESCSLGREMELVEIAGFIVSCREDERFIVIRVELWRVSVSAFAVSFHLSFEAN